MDQLPQSRMPSPREGGLGAAGGTASADLPVAELVKRAVSSECGSDWPRLSITVAVENALRIIPDRRGELEP
jgi:hypothetical protein